MMKKPRKLSRSLAIIIISFCMDPLYNFFIKINAKLILGQVRKRQKQRILNKGRKTKRKTVAFHQLTNNEDKTLNIRKSRRSN